MAVPLKKVVKHASFERSVSENLVVRVDAGRWRGRLRGGGARARTSPARRWISAFERAVSARLGRPDRPAGRLRRGRRAARSAAAPGDRGRPPRHGGQRGALRPGTGRARCVRPPLRRVGGAGRRAGRGRRARSGTRPRNRVRYSGAITAESTLGEWRTAVKIRIYGFHQVKVKVGTQGQDDPRRLRALRWILGRRMDIRLDANEAWPASELIERVEPLRRFGPTALEQPVPHAEVDALAELRPRLGMPVMLDESLCGFPDAEAAVARRTADIFNVRHLQVRRHPAIAADHRAGPALGAGCAARLPPGRDRRCSRPRDGTSPAGWPTCVMSRAPMIATSSAANLTRQDLTFGYGGWAQSPGRPGAGRRSRPGRARGDDRPDPGDPV